MTDRLQAGSVLIEVRSEWGLPHAEGFSSRRRLSATTCDGSSPVASSEAGRSLASLVSGAVALGGGGGVAGLASLLWFAQAASPARMTATWTALRIRIVRGC